ncbi:MAG: hypothetical protein JWM56_97 [Candidatus Peribacteria bacterium]|nr:hypothetical protein [Candidatus Peribacteria bacterium]
MNQPEQEIPKYERPYRVDKNEFAHGIAITLVHPKTREAISATEYYRGPLVQDIEMGERIVSTEMKDGKNKKTSIVTFMEKIDEVLYVETARKGNLYRIDGIEAPRQTTHDIRVLAQKIADAIMAIEGNLPEGALITIKVTPDGKLNGIEEPSKNVYDYAML